MSERVEWRVVCDNGNQPIEARSRLHAESIAADAETDRFACCGPHRVQHRTVTTSEWADLVDGSAGQVTA